MTLVVGKAIPEYSQVSTPLGIIWCFRGAGCVILIIFSLSTGKIMGLRVEEGVDGVVGEIRTYTYCILVVKFLQ